MLSGDIKILKCMIDLKERIEICDGVNKAKDLYQEYIDEAFIPRLPWRKLSKTEADYILTEDKSNTEEYNNYVSIIGIDSSVCYDLQKTYFDQAHLHGNINISAHIERVLEEINKNCISQNVISSGIAKSNVGLPTTTIDTSIGLFVGLHLDSWDRLRLNERKNSTNRICINIGNDERYLIFCDHSISSIARIINVTNEMNPNLDEMVYNFFQTNMHYPIIKIRINPFEAYIAPTENFIHDGWSLGNNKEDLTCVFRGIFKIKPRINF